ncbi:MAG: NAD(P)-binding protein, partial [Leptolyngbya sp.]|nr:NAD(P)-binding protein [Candidatus Melainabacteria bacterium]
MKKAKIAVVGAGLAGLTCANILSKNGMQVSLFDKGRFPGGRLASRERDEDTFDYGAQYLTAKDLRFVQFLAPLLNSGKVAKWNGIFKQSIAGELSPDILAKPRFVGVPSMRSIADEITKSENLNCTTSHLVTKLFRKANKWYLEGIKQIEPEETFTEGDFDFLVLNMPPAQAAALHPHVELEDLVLMPCCAVLVTLKQRISLDCDGVSLDDEIISWVARDSSKPGRLPGER